MKGNKIIIIRKQMKEKKMMWQGPATKFFLQTLGPRRLHPPHPHPPRPWLHGCVADHSSSLLWWTADPRWTYGGIRHATSTSRRCAPRCTGPHNGLRSNYRRGRREGLSPGRGKEVGYGRRVTAVSEEMGNIVLMAQRRTVYSRDVRRYSVTHAHKKMFFCCCCKSLNY